MKCNKRKLYLKFKRTLQEFFLNRNRLFESMGNFLIILFTGEVPRVGLNSLAKFKYKFGRLKSEKKAKLNIYNDVVMTRKNE